MSISIMEVSFRICREFVAKEVAMYNTINHLDAVILPNLATKVWNIASVHCQVLYASLSLCLSVGVNVTAAENCMVTTPYIVFATHIPL